MFRLKLRGHPSALYLALCCMGGALVSGCGLSPTDEGEDRTVVLRIEGRVVSEPGEAPIAGARVDLGWGGHFSLPEVRKSDTTDVEGRYQIVDTLTYVDPCPFQWMQANAEGHVGIRGIMDSRVGVLCTASVQTIGIPLSPSGS